MASALAKATQTEVSSPTLTLYLRSSQILGLPRLPGLQGPKSLSVAIVTWDPVTHIRWLSRNIE